MDAAEADVMSDAQASSDDELIEVSDACPECGRTFSAPAGAWPSADVKLRAHRAKSHGLAKPPTSRRRRKATVVEVATKASPSTTPPGGEKAPTAKEWQEALGDAVAELSKLPATHAARTDPVIHRAFPPEQWPALYRELEAKLSLSPQDAQTLMSPVARRIAASRWNARSGRAIIANRDLIPAISVVISLAAQWRSYLAQRADAVRRLEAAQTPAPAAPTVTLNGTNPEMPADYRFRISD